MNGKDLLKALRAGTVPQDGVAEILVGHEHIILELNNELNEVKNINSSSIRFIQGEFGSGKTMLTSYLMEQALLMNFCVSQIIIDPTVQLSNFTQIYNAFCQNLRTPLSPDNSGIVSILESWSLQQLRIYQKVEGLDRVINNVAECQAFISHLENELVAVRNLDPALSHAISAFAGAKVLKNSELAKYALNWIRASDKIPARDYSKQLGLKGKINADDAYNFLKGILLLIKETGFSGSLIVLDEVETIRRLPQKTVRQKAYEILRHILDDTAAGLFTNTFFLITATKEFFNERTGIKEYPALEERIKQIKINKTENALSNKQPILELMPMQEKELRSLAVKIRKIHGTAEEWNIFQKVSDTELNNLAERIATGAFGIKESGPRDFIRHLIEAFDLLKANPQKVIADLIPTPDGLDE